MWRRRKKERDLQRELDSHMELEAEELGGDPYAARRAFGNATRIKENTRAVWGWVTLERLAQDLHYAFRAMRKSPAFTTTAVLSLALGIGANTAIFSLFEALLLRQLPVRAPGELVLLTERTRDRVATVLSMPQYRSFAESETLAGLCAWRPWQAQLTGREGAQFAGAVLVSGNCSAVLGVDAYLGRTLVETDDREPVAVLSYGYWQRQFGADTSVLGRALTVQGQPYTVVGVMEPGFHGIDVGSQAEIFLPLGMQPAIIPAPLLQSPTARWLTLIGRRKEGVPIQQVQADLSARWARLAQELPRGKNANSRVEVVPANRGIGDLRPQLSLPLQVTMAAVALILLAACANLASLLLARASARRQEIDVRLALGASRGRLLRQLLTESVLLSAIGGALAIGIAGWAGPFLVAAISRGRDPIPLDVSVSASTLAFCGALSLATGILFGILPALRATRQRDTTPTLRARAQAGSRRWTGAMVVAQVAVCLVILISAGLLMGSLRNLQGVDAGFRKVRVLLVQIRPGTSNYKGPRAVGLYEALQQRFRAIPGVESVAPSLNPPLGGVSITPGGYSMNAVGSGFFETMGIPLVAGRDIAELDTRSAPAVSVVSESAARALFPDRNPIGQRFLAFRTETEVVGVVGDIRYRGLREPVDPMVYVSYKQFAEADGGLFFGIRTSGDPQAIIPFVQRELREAARDVPAASIETLEDRVDATLMRERMVASLCSLFGGFALLLASIGLYGRLSYAVAERTREIGVRMALGARQGPVVWMISRDALLLTLAGIAIGLPLALASTRVLRSMLFDTNATDPATYAAMVAVMVAVTASASYLPARRAASVDPMTALRHE